MPPSFRTPPAAAGSPGARPRSNAVARLGFNGQLHESIDWWQFLGNGYRVYNPALMRFHSPDSESPFGRGGINVYAYCVVDPVNRADPTGHWALSTLLTTLVPYKFKAMPVAGMLAGAAASLGFAGVAVTTKDDTQKGLVIAASVIAAAGAFVAGRYAWTKRKPRLAQAKTAGPMSTPPPTPGPHTSTSTPSTRSTLGSPTSPVSPTTMTTSTTRHPRPNDLSISAGVPNPALKRAAPPPPSPAQSQQRAPLEAQVCRIRSPSVRSQGVDAMSR
jgi:RHS repeat-associated protein